MKSDALSRSVNGTGEVFEHAARVFGTVMGSVTRFKGSDGHSLA